VIAAILATAGLAITGSPEREVLASSVPDATDGLVLHWDASVASSLRDTGGGTIEGGDAVGSWVDLVSGVTASAVTSVAGVNRPTYSATAGPGGTPTVEFDAAWTQGLETSPLALFPSASSGLTVVIVFVTDNVSSQNFLLMHDTGNCSTNVEIGLATGNVVAGNWGIHSGCSNADVTPGGTITTGAPFIVSTTLATTGATPNHVVHRVNGSSRVTQTHQSGYAPAGSYPTASAKLRIGFRQQDPWSPNSYFDGRISEIMIFDRPLETDRIIELERRLASDFSMALFSPGRPDPVTASATPSSTTVSWAVPVTGGSAIQGYDVTVSAAGAPVATCSTPPGTTSCVVSGLTVGVTHTVTVTATNAIGVGVGGTTTFVVPAAPMTSSPSAAPPPPPPTTVAPTTTTSVPSSTPPDDDPPLSTEPPPGPGSPGPETTVAPVPGEDPALVPGFVSAVDGSRSVDVILEQIAPSAWRITNDEFVVDLAARQADGTAIRVDGLGTATLVTGGLVETSGSGFAPGTLVDAWLFSEPRLIGRITVDATGSFSGSLAVPDDLAIGNHSLLLTGQSGEGLRRSVSLGVRIIGGDTVIAAPRTELPSTGAVPVGLLGSFGAVVLGLLARGLRRRLIATR
jgi:hypothetical protein